MQPHLSTSVDRGYPSAPAKEASQAASPIGDASNFDYNSPPHSPPRSQPPPFSTTFAAFTEPPVSSAGGSEKRHRSVSPQNVGGGHTSDNSDAESMGTTHRRACSPSLDDAAASRRERRAELLEAARQYSQDMVRTAHGRLPREGRSEGRGVVPLSPAVPTPPGAAERRGPGSDASALDEAAAIAAARTLLAMQPSMAWSATWPVVKSGINTDGVYVTTGDPAFRICRRPHPGRACADEAAAASAVVEAPAAVQASAAEANDAPATAAVPAHALLGWHSRAIAPRPLSSAAGHVTVVAKQWQRQPTRSSHIQGAAPGPPLHSLLGPRQNVGMALLNATIRTTIGPDPAMQRANGTVTSVTEQTRGSTADNVASGDLVATLAALPACSTASAAAPPGRASSAADAGASETNLVSLFQSIAAVVPRRDAPAAQPQPQRRSRLPPLERCNSSSKQPPSHSPKRESLHRLDALAAVAAAAAESSAAAESKPSAASLERSAQQPPPPPPPGAAIAKQEQEAAAAMAVVSLLKALKQDVPASEPELRSRVPQAVDLRHQLKPSTHAPPPPQYVHPQPFQGHHMHALEAARTPGSLGVVVSTVDVRRPPSGHPPASELSAAKLLEDALAAEQNKTLSKGIMEPSRGWPSCACQPDQAASTGGHCCERAAAGHGAETGAGTAGTAIRNGGGVAKPRQRTMRSRVTRLVHPVRRAPGSHLGPGGFGTSRSGVCGPPPWVLSGDAPGGSHRASIGDPSTGERVGQCLSSAAATPFPRNTSPLSSSPPSHT
jgi:hypothetical protein